MDVLSTPQRWMQILNECLYDYENAVARGVKYRIVLDSCKIELSHQKNIQALISRPNFNLRLSSSSLCVNAGIFDGKEATFCFYPSKPLPESPIIWTNHPSFLAMFQSYFENIWASSLCATEITKNSKPNSANQLKTQTEQLNVG